MKRPLSFLLSCMLSFSIALPVLGYFNDNTVYASSSSSAGGYEVLKDQYNYIPNPSLNGAWCIDPKKPLVNDAVSAFLYDKVGSGLVLNQTRTRDYIKNTLHLEPTNHTATYYDYKKNQWVTESNLNVDLEQFVKWGRVVMVKPGFSASGSGGTKGGGGVPVSGGNAPKLSYYTCQNEYQYLGYTYQGYPLSNPFYPDLEVSKWFEATNVSKWRSLNSQYVKNASWVPTPWTAGSLVDKKLSDPSYQNSTMPHPRLVEDYPRPDNSKGGLTKCLDGYWYKLIAGQPLRCLADRVLDLKQATDRFDQFFAKNPDLYDSGYFLNSPQFQYQNFNDQGLSDYAYVLSYPTDYTDGMFVMYVDYAPGVTDKRQRDVIGAPYGCSYAICYKTFFMRHKKPFFQPSLDASVSLTVNPTTYAANDILKGTIDISNKNGDNLKIKAPCDVNAAAGYASCGTPAVPKSKNMTIDVVDTKTGQSVYSQSQPFVDIAANAPALKLDLSTYNIALPAVGTYKVTVTIPTYGSTVNGKLIPEAVVANNSANTTVTVSGSPLLPNDASVVATLNKTSFAPNEIIGGKVTVNNTLKTKISAPCTKGATKCKAGGRTDFTVKVFDSANKAVATKTLTYTINANGNYVVDIATLGFKLPAGTYTLTASIPEYATETVYTNNVSSVSFPVGSLPQNAKVKISETPYTYTDGTPLTNSVSVTNDMSNPISGTLTIKVKDDNSNTYIKTLSVPYNSIPVGQSVVYDLTNDNIIVNSGPHTIEASIDRYPAESDFGKANDDNHDSLPITVKAFIPENVDCKELSGYSTTVVKGLAGFTKLCIGSLPKFPSTKVENGQNTYFYVKYKFNPWPMPAYEITNLDDKGLEQTYAMSEPKDALGACDSGNLNATSDQCNAYEPFIYYPSTSANKKGLLGPYTAGPHSFYHYMYRGRLFPKSATFSFTISDPTGAVIPKASGDLYYELDPKKCYDDTVLDIKDECRSVDFYLPKDPSVTKGTVANPLKVPTDIGFLKLPKEQDRLQFLNPGIHTFQMKVKEEQVYRYQFDNGAEYQGDPNVKTETGAPGPIKRYDRASWANKDVYEPDNTFKNHCYTQEEAFGNQTSAGCFHDNDKQFQYWNFDWSKPLDYGSLY